MQVETHQIASNESLNSIVAVIGLKYNEFKHNMQVMFPKTGEAIVKALVNGQQDRLYSTFIVFKKRCKKRKARLVYSPRKELKQLQTLMDTFVRSQFQDHKISHGFVTGKSTRTAAESVMATPHLNEKEMTNLDIAGAFPAVTGRAIRSLLRHKVQTGQLNNWQIRILSSIATNSSDKLATGAPTSPSIFNWKLTAADAEIERLCSARGWKAIRYADDVSVIHYRSQKRDVIEAIQGIFNRFGLKIERSKLKTFRTTVKTITGLTVQHGLIRISRRLRRLHRALAHQVSRTYQFTAKNNYTEQESFDCIKAIGQEAFKKDSLEAQAVGFWAYNLHAVMKLRNQQC